MNILDKLLQIFSKPQNTDANDMNHLIVGLGNIGSEYAGTRHNIGFTVLDAMAETAGVTFQDKRYGFVAEMKVKNQNLILLKPSTYMNLSGNAVRYWMKEKKVDLERVLVVVDDLALPVGALRLKGQGSDGGHNGLKHIATILGTTNYARLRFGIGNDFSKGRQVDFVLGTFDSEEQKVVDAQAETVGEIIKSFCFAGLARTMNQFNKKGVGKE